MKNKINDRIFLFEMTKKLNPDFKIKPSLVDDSEIISEEIRPSYPQDLINDIKLFLGLKPTLSQKEIEFIAKNHNVSIDVVKDALEYVLMLRREEEESSLNLSKEAKEINDFFSFLKNDPKVGSFATCWYASTLNRYLAKPKSNPMIDRFLKLTKYSFEWNRTYEDAVQRKNPDWVVQQRKGSYTKVEGFSCVKFDAKGDEVLDIVPSSSKSIVLVLDENGDVSDTVSTLDLKLKYSQHFQPSFFTPKDVSKGSGVEFRPLKVYAIKRLAAGGKVWINEHFKFERYSKYFDLI